MAFAIGVALLFSAAGSATLVAVFAGLGIALTGGSTVAILARKALGTRRLRQRNSLVGRMGVARGADCVFVDGALWRARLRDSRARPRSAAAIPSWSSTSMG